MDVGILVVFLTVPVLMAMHWLSSHVNVWFSLKSYRDSLPPMLVCLAPLCTYFVLFGLLMTNALFCSELLYPVLGRAAILGGGLTFMASVSLTGVIFRQMSLGTVRR